MPNEDEELPGYHAAADRPSCSNVWYTVESVDKIIKFHETLLTLYQILQRGAFCQVPFQWIYYYASNKCTGPLCSIWYSVKSVS